jgi:ankyrin repeat protein
MAEAARLLETAFRNDDCEAVRQYIKRGYDCRAVDPNTNFTLLHLVMGLSCTDCDKSSMAQSLIKAGNPVDARDTDGRTPLMYCRSPALAAVLLDHGVDINASSKQGHESRFTCLMTAVASDNLSMVQLLLSRGACVDAGNEGYGTALALACNLGHLAIARVLLAAGVDATGQCLLHVALCKVAEPDVQLELLQVLLQYNAPVDEVDGEGVTPLMQCMRASAGCRAASMLLQAGADVNTAQTGGGSCMQMTALHYAAYISTPDMLKMLLAAGASTSSRCCNGCLPLHNALRDSSCSTSEVGPTGTSHMIMCSRCCVHGSTELISYNLCLLNNRSSRE